jgi:hypothetical protein
MAKKTTPRHQGSCCLPSYFMVFTLHLRLALGSRRRAERNAWFSLNAAFTSLVSLSALLKKISVVFQRVSWKQQGILWRKAMNHLMFTADIPGVILHRVCCKLKFVS